LQPIINQVMAVQRRNTLLAQALGQLATVGGRLIVPQVVYRQTLRLQPLPVMQQGGAVIYQLLPMKGVLGEEKRLFHQPNRQTQLQQRAIGKQLVGKQQDGGGQAGLQVAKNMLSVRALPASGSTSAPTPPSSPASIP
jgi:hypothetical protein